MTSTEDGMRAVTNDRRELIIEAKQRGETETEIALWLKVSVRTARRVWRQFREEGSVPPAPGRSRGRPPKLAPGDIGRIGDEVARAPDATLAELIERLSLPIGKSQLARLLARLGLTLKKRRSVRRTSSARTCAKRGGTGPRPKRA
jgi:transposase